VAVDTNVFISAALKEKTPPETAVHLAAASHLLLKSTITEGVVRHLAPTPPRAVDSARFSRLAARADGGAELVNITERIAACRDPKDDKFLELAVNDHADVLITGDRDLLALNPFRGVPIITPPPTSCRTTCGKTTGAIPRSRQRDNGPGCA
jgi:uncharacterized protein